MKIKLVNRYYCDHCGKGVGRSATMTRHERGCTKNPNRVCGVCAHAGEQQKPLKELVAALEIDAAHCGESYDGIYPYRTEELANGCPACVLAAIRQSGIDPCIWSFRFKDEMEAYWKAAHADEDR